MKISINMALLTLVGFTLGSGPAAVAQEEQDDKWAFDVSLYGLAAGMSGDVTARGISADLDMSFGDILDNLEFGAMGKFRVGYERWSFNTEVIYMGLGASKNGFKADMDQWIVEPTVDYETGSGPNEFKYDILTQGPQLGVTFRF